ncbi:MAG: SAM-dependent methyltransferase, partial [Pseudonocardiaceae bacterium]
MRSGSSGSNHAERFSISYDVSVDDRFTGTRSALPSTEFARASRGFLHRAVHHLAAEVDIRQFLDIGPGLPTRNTHHIAQGIAPDCHIVYVDHDPLVLLHARALLTSTAHTILTRLLDPLPAGSYLLLVHPTALRYPAAMRAATHLWNTHT